ncbi:MAG: hypothetical protein M3P08_04630 [Thermoproteota archaeon]|jgi:hypothetical protein|nr:hypothetical protein [Thermoproteota archaeon]
MSSNFLFKPYVILTVAVAVQSFHILEHMVQVIQKFVLQFPVAHGILGASLDFERGFGRLYKDTNQKDAAYLWTGYFRSSISIMALHRTCSKVRSTLN